MLLIYYLFIVERRTGPRTTEDRQTDDCQVSHSVAGVQTMTLVGAADGGFFLFGQLSHFQETKKKEQKSRKRKSKQINQKNKQVETQ